MTDIRCARQRLLPEVGADGQEKLRRTPVGLAEGPGADVAWEYLRRAGVQRREQLDGLPPTFPHATHLRYAAPSAVAQGAWSALRHVRRALNLT